MGSSSSPETSVLKLRCVITQKTEDFIVIVHLEFLEPEKCLNWKFIQTLVADFMGPNWARTSRPLFLKHIRVELFRAQARRGMTKLMVAFRNFANAPKT
jgi:hypothetical protein